MPETPALPAVDQNQPDKPPELTETLELLATIAASLSDRVDEQGKKLVKLERTAAETRSAAFAAEKATDPEVPVKMIKEALLGEKIHMAEAAVQLQGSSARVHKIGKLLKERSDADRKQISELLQKAQSGFEARKVALEAECLNLRKAYRTRAILFALLCLVLLAVAPPLMMRAEWGCGFLGGDWNKSTLIDEYCTIRP